MDRSSGNQKLLEELSKERKADKHHQLTNIGSCGLHTIHSAFKTDAEMEYKAGIKRSISSLSRFSLLFHNSATFYKQL